MRRMWAGAPKYRCYFPEDFVDRQSVKMMLPMRRNGVAIMPTMLQNQAEVSVELTASRQLGQP